jgi:hypothetical protein
MAVNVEAAWVKYATVAASQTAQVLKTGTRLGSVGDKLRSLVIVPSTTSPGAVNVLDGTRPSTSTPAARRPFRP